MRMRNREASGPLKIVTIQSSEGLERIICYSGDVVCISSKAV